MIACAAASARAPHRPVRRLRGVTRRAFDDPVALHIALDTVTRPPLDNLRTLASAVVTTARQVSPTRLAIIIATAAAVLAVVVLVPLPTAVQLRDWATSVGPWFPLAFLGAHIVMTVLPFPRTAFTLAAGLLFGPALGVTIAVVAATCSALVALLLVRALGWQLNRLVNHPGVDAMDTRLRERGWQAVLSVRLIPAVPFSVLNYAAGASAVQVLPYLLATVAGLLPGTTAVVILGDAMTGRVNPLLMAISLCTGALGIAGLIYESRLARRGS